MLFLLFRLIGPRRLVTPTNFVVLVVRRLPVRLKRFGLIGDRRSTLKATVVSGKSFISVVNVTLPGGPGVRIVLLLNMGSLLAIAMNLRNRSELSFSSLTLQFVELTSHL